MTKPPVVSNLTGTPELSLVYDSVFWSDPSRSKNSLPISRLKHPKNIVGLLELTFNNIGSNTVPPALVKRLCLHNSWLQHLDLTLDPIHF